MDDLIRRQAAIDAVMITSQEWDGMYIQDLNCRLRNALNALPSAQSERKRGCWVGIDDEPCDVYECDQCGTTYDTIDNTWDLPYFCPHCGADMRAEETDCDYERAAEQLEHDILYEPTFNPDDGSM